VQKSVIGLALLLLLYDPNAIDVLRLVMSLPFAGAGPATKRQRRDAKFPRGEG
jgi:hypothetical protein